MISPSSSTTRVLARLAASSKPTRYSSSVPGARVIQRLTASS
jgi:hypothetical protein